MTTNPHIIKAPTPTPIDPLEHKFQFTGTILEYFPIWLSNVALTVLTLGIYGAWAKVRREQYFHSHTFLAGHSFEYTANPISILKGRLLLFGLLFLFFFINGAIPVLGPIVLILAVIAFPWIATQALKFKARYTSYRNIPFQFHGTYGRSFKYLILTRTLGILTLGLLLPWGRHRERKYIVTSLSYGTERFGFNATVWDYAKIYLGILFLFAVPLLLLCGVFIFNALLPLLSSGILSGVNPEDQESVKEAIKLFMDNGGLMIFILGFFVIISMQIIIPFLIRFLVARATWDNASIGPFLISYKASLFKFIWIGVTNILLRLVTFGLASPNCAIRMYRFKINAMSFFGEGDFSGFKGQSVEGTRAFGEELSSAYDLDIDLGF